MASTTTSSEAHQELTPATGEVEEAGGVATTQDAGDGNGNNENEATTTTLFLGDVDESQDRGNDDADVNDSETDGLMAMTNNDADGNADCANVRLGTTSSARFNILSTMVGGGSLSLAYAFDKTGNALASPILLLAIAAMSEFCFRLLVQAARVLSYRDQSNLGSLTKPGNDSFESIAAAAFGSRAHVGCMALVTSMCFFGTVGYAVLLRDMLQPITVAVHGHHVNAGPNWANNASLWCVVLAVTPLCTLQTLTSLKRFGAASMGSVLILGCCIVYRSLECHLVPSETRNPHWHSWRDSVQLLPANGWQGVLDAFPLYISCYVCHYNILTVHNELQRPTVARVKWWLQSTTWVATLFYLVMGVAGSAYGAKCTASGHVQSNVLLSFGNSDPLLLVGRLCLAITITLAFPMLTIPARDIVLREWHAYSTQKTRRERHAQQPLLNDAVAESDCVEAASASALEEPLLPRSTDEEAAAPAPEPANDAPSTSFSFLTRLLVSMLLFWSAATVASVVDSIDVVWDLLGSSLSILLSVLIPAASFLVLTASPRQNAVAPAAANGPTSPESPPEPSSLLLNGGGSMENADEQEPTFTWDTLKHWTSRTVAWVLLILFVPLMFLSTGNAVYHTFFEKWQY